MININMIKQIDNKKHIAILDTSSISFMQILQNNSINMDEILCDYDLILIPGWVLTEIEDAEGRADYLQDLIKAGHPIYGVSEEVYTNLTGYEEGNLYQIVLAASAMLGRIRSYLRRFVECDNSFDMDAYDEWIRKLYKEWPIPGEELASGRVRKKNAGEVSITILAEILSWYYPETEVLTVYSQDRDVYEFQRKAEMEIRALFAAKTPVPVSYKSNDAILCQLFRTGVISADDTVKFRKDERRMTYSKEQPDHSVALVTELVGNDSFKELLQDRSVHIIF